MSFLLKNHILCESVIVALLFMCFFVFSKTNNVEKIQEKSKNIMLETKKMLTSI